MTRVRLDQLPASVRRQVEAAMTTGKPRPAKSRAGTSAAAPCAGTCQCGEQFPTYRRWETHADATHHGRWTITLTTEETDCGELDSPWRTQRKARIVLPRSATEREIF